MKREVVVLRLNHRPERDKRLSTHVFLAARALAASCCIYTGVKDNSLEKSVSDVIERWGGKFKFGYEKDWKKVIKKYKKREFVIVHLTMYGIPIQDVIKKIRKIKKILVVIGGEKVPANIYHLADFNVAITNQPHSEVAALSIFLHEYFQGRELSKKFLGAKLKIIPQERKKIVIKDEGNI